MAMTWGQIRKYFIQAAGGSEESQEEAWDHITEGYRFVATHPNVEVPELSSIDELVEVADGADKVLISAIDFTIFAIQSVFNLTSGFIMYPDPGGMMGRERYLQKDTGMPPAGTVTNYTRDGVYLYVRNTSVGKTNLRIRAIKQVPTIGDADINSSPITPSQYDWTIIHAAAANYYRIHPAYSAAADGSQGESMADRFTNQANVVLSTPKPVEREQDRIRRESMVLRGYRMSPKSGRRY